VVYARVAARTGLAYPHSLDSLGRAFRAGPDSAHREALSVRLSRTGLWHNPDFQALDRPDGLCLRLLITRTALPFAAILTLDATPFQVALLGASNIVAGLLVGLLAGVWVDRLRRRPLMIASDLLRALLLLPSRPPRCWMRCGSSSSTSSPSSRARSRSCSMLPISPTCRRWSGGRN
jgi:hypothetical protein